MFKTIVRKLNENGLGKEDALKLLLESIISAIGEEKALEHFNLNISEEIEDYEVVYLLDYLFSK